MSAAPPAAPPAARLSPVDGEERITAIDVLRGVAVLGILLINIEDFALPHADKSAAGTEWVGAYMPALSGRGALLAWIAVRALFEGKMRAIFSMVFGAGVVLLTARLERRGAGGRAADVYYRRTLWLLLIGVLHAYLLWEGDILYSYALVGLVLFPFRGLGARRLLAAGGLVLALSIPRAALEARHRGALRAEAAQVSAAEAAGQAPGKRQREARAEWDEIVASFRPDPQTLRDARDDYRGGYRRLFARRADLVREVESTDFYGWAFFDSIGMMLIGMGLFKAGVLGAERSRRFYRALAALGLGLGLPISAAASYRMYLERFDPVAVAWLGALYDPARLAVALGEIGLVMLVVRAGRLGALTARLGDVGRVALTSYLSATLICTTLFNGYGFGLFGALSRPQLYAVVAAIWVFQVGFARLWLRAFRFGPAEWAWRSLTYWKPQPLRRERAAALSAVRVPDGGR